MLVLCVVSSAESIRSWLKELQCPLDVISPAVEALQKLCQASVAGPKNPQVGHLLKYTFENSLFPTQGVSAAVSRLWDDEF